MAKKQKNTPKDFMVWNLNKQAQPLPTLNNIVNIMCLMIDDIDSPEVLYRHKEHDEDEDKLDREMKVLDEWCWYLSRKYKIDVAEEIVARALRLVNRAVGKCEDGLLTEFINELKTQYLNHKKGEETNG